MSAPSLRERVAGLCRFTFAGLGSRALLDNEQVACIATDGDARIAELAAEVERLRIAGMHRVKSLDLREECERLRAEVARLSAPVGVEPVATVVECSEVDIDGKPLAACEIDWYPNDLDQLPIGSLLYPESAIRALQARLAAADTQLSRVLHELAGSASLCWEPKPTGVFASSQASEFCSGAIEELRAILRGDAARTASTGEAGS